MAVICLLPVQLCTTLLSHIPEAGTESRVHSTGGRIDLRFNPKRGISIVKGKEARIG